MPLGFERPLSAVLGSVCCGTALGEGGRGVAPTTLANMTANVRASTPKVAETNSIFGSAWILFRTFIDHLGQK